MKHPPGLSSSSLVLLLLFFFLFFCDFLCSAVEEREILLQIKAEWGNPPSLSSWTNSSSSGHCGWNGVGCNSEGSVISITLREQGISGGVPNIICELKNLSSLDLFNNSIGGGFPTALYGCKNLSELVFSQNLFVGGIPDDIGRLSSLKSLDLSYNNFSGDVPVNISGIAGLRELKLEYNLFNGTFPKELAELAELEYLSMAENPFSPTRIPPEFGGMKSLKYLWISSASLFGEIPEAIGNLTALEHLDLSENDLAGGIPPAILQLLKLQKLYLYNNRLSGEIQKITAVNLTELDLSANNLSGSLPDDFGDLIHLQSLVLYNNRFSGQIPYGISKIPFLSDIRLFNNLLSGVLPPELGQNSNLTYLEIAGNKLQGELPKNLCGKGMLNSVAAFDNQLSGSLPETLAGCESLAYIQIQNNKFSGEIPAGIWSLPKLEYLVLHDNEFAGDLPEKLPPQLSRLEITNNKFSGGVPSSSPQLLVFSASNNGISGELPSDLSAMANLQELLLDGNQISGPIPPGIEVLASLTRLNLSGNLISGRIPAEIASLTSLTLLDLSRNQLSGEIPVEIGNLKLSFLNFSSNSLSGQVPEPLQNAAYNLGFLSNRGLCTLSTSPLNLPACGGAANPSGNLPPKWVLSLLPILAVLFVLAVFAIPFMVYLNRRKPFPADLSWNFTAFQSLDFDESTIIRGLHAGNLIGSGGSGHVFRIQTGSRSAVAVKQIRSTHQENPKLEQEFLSEVQILASLRHTNIVKLLAFASGPNSMLLVYEFMQNESLADRLQTLDWPTRLSIAIDVARGLSYMHHDCNPPIIHRDVKSSNVLLDSEFRAKVADFGLARAVAKPGELELASAVAGSVGYMAPECGYSRRVSEKGDVYSFGVVLLELVSGRAAGEEGSSLVEWARKSFQENAPLGSPPDNEGMAAALRVGVFCTGDLPSARPTMKEVLRVLLRLAGKDDFQQVLVGVDGQDKAPLLRYASKKKSSKVGSSGGDQDSIV